MRLAICQPTYLPWLGYFDLMDQVDTFVFLDTVQFEKQSWQQRNRIKTPSGLQWITVPIIFRGRFGQSIQEVEIRNTDFVRIHLRAIELNYSRSSCFKDVFAGLSTILKSVKPGSQLAEFNIRLIQWAMELLGIRQNLVLASSLKPAGRRTELLANICRSLGASEYVSPVGSAEYLLSDLSVMTDANIQTTFHHYIHPEYEQRFPPFLPFASVVDLLFNEGERAMEIIRSGRRTRLKPDELPRSVQQSNEGSPKTCKSVTG